MRNWLANRFENEAIVSNHFVDRLYQRFDKPTRNKILVKTMLLLKNGQFETLSLLEGRRLVLVDDVIVGLSLQNNKVALKTVFRANARTLKRVQTPQ